MLSQSVSAEGHVGGVLLELLPNFGVWLARPGQRVVLVKAEVERVHLHTAGLHLLRRVLHVAHLRAVELELSQVLPQHHAAHLLIGGLEHAAGVLHLDLLQVHVHPLEQVPRQHYLLDLLLQRT
mgnify:CR=1 FL=1